MNGTPSITTLPYYPHSTQKFSILFLQLTTHYVNLENTSIVSGELDPPLFLLPSGYAYSDAMFILVLLVTMTKMVIIQV